MENATLELNDLMEAWTPTHVLFWKPPSPFSQWTNAPFELGGVAYGCSEQFMMAEKARLFGDESTLAQVLKEPDPAAQQRLGRRVSPYDGERWREARFDAVVRGNMGKFGQNVEMLEHLLSTNDRMLVEASPQDRIWGVGLGPRNPKATDPAEWRGTNLLGEVLMRVRERLRTL